MFDILELFGFVGSTDVVVAPPFVYIDQVKNSITDRIEISAQNSWVGKGGAFTGEIRLACPFLLLECRKVFKNILINS